MAKALSVEKETTDFGYRLIYQCPDCKAKLGHTVHNDKRCFGAGTVMKNNHLPKFCPDCGCELSDMKDLSTAKCEEGLWK